MNNPRFEEPIIRAAMESVRMTLHTILDQNHELDSDALADKIVERVIVPLLNEFEREFEQLDASITAASQETNSTTSTASQETSALRKNNVDVSI